MKILIFFLFPIFFLGQNNSLKINYSKNFNGKYCSFEYRKYERENIPYKAIGVEESFSNFKFSAYIKNADIPMVQNCLENRLPFTFSEHKRKDENFEKDMLLIYIDGKKIPLSENIGLLNVPEKLILFSDSKFQYIIFQIGEFLINTSNYSRPEITTFILKFDKKHTYKDQFVYKSSNLESVKQMYHRYLKKNKTWK